MGEDEVADVTVVAGGGGGAEADASGVPFVDPVGEARLAGLGVGVVAGVEVGLDGA